MVTARNNYSGLFELRESGSGYLYFGTDIDGTSLVFFDATGGPSSTIATLVAGTPFAWAVTSTGTGAGQTTGYYRAVGSNVWSSATYGRGAFVPAALQIGNDQYSEWFNGRFRDIKCWDRALTADELLVESFYERVKFPTSLNFHWPLRSSTDTGDYSGNGRNPTVGGTLTTEDTGWQPWKVGAQVQAPAAAAGTSVGRADETDSALALVGFQLRVAGRSDETDSALALSAVSIRAAGAATETDTSIALTPVQIGAAGLASETDTALALSAGAGTAVGMAVETDAALALAAVQIAVADIATELDSAQALAAVQIRATGTTTETDVALSLTPVQLAQVGMAGETNTALALLAVGPQPAGMATETDTAFALLPGVSGGGGFVRDHTVAGRRAVAEAARRERRERDEADAAAAAAPPADVAPPTPARTRRGPAPVDEAVERARAARVQAEALQAHMEVLREQHALDLAESERIETQIARLQQAQLDEIAIALLTAAVQ